MSGSVNGPETGVEAFMIGGTANLIGRGALGGMASRKASRIMSLPVKEKKSAIGKLKPEFDTYTITMQSIR